MIYCVVVDAEILAQHMLYVLFYSPSLINCLPEMSLMYKNMIYLYRRVKDEEPLFPTIT